MSFIKDKLRYFRKKKEVNHHAFGTSSTDSVKTKRAVVVAAIGLAAVLMIVLVVQPAITGYAVSQDIRASGADPETYGAELAQAQIELESTRASLQACQTSQDTLSAETQVYQQEAQDAKSQLQTQMSSLGSQLETERERVKSLFKDLEETEEELEKIEDSNEAVFHNAAEQLCCIQRILDADIDSYDINIDNDTPEDSSIECRTSNDGDHELSC